MRPLAARAPCALEAPASRRAAFLGAPLARRAGAPPPPRAADPYVLAKLEETEASFRELQGRMASPEVANDATEYQRIAMAVAELQEAVDQFAAYKVVAARLADAREMARDDADAEMAELAAAEASELAVELELSAERLKLLLLPRDPLDERSVMLEVRAGTGGGEAALWAADLVRMYQRYADMQGWKAELVSGSESEAGGYKEAVLQVSGARVYSKLKFESGVHRVQVCVCVRVCYSFF
jgi:peptide chain release factor 1